jgi:UDP:flavonoid glycosyltransferase YjiC (YdhE family)
MRVRESGCASPGPPAQIGPAVEAVLTEPSYRQAAQRVQETFRAAGGAVAAASQLAELAACGAGALDAGGTLSR